MEHLPRHDQGRRSLPLNEQPLGRGMQFPRLTTGMGTSICLFPTTCASLSEHAPQVPGENVNCNWKRGPGGVRAAWFAPPVDILRHRNNGDGRFTDVSQEAGIAECNRLVTE